MTRYEAVDHQHVVMFSSGVGSWATAKRVAEQYGTDNLTLLFTDVKGKNPSPHAGEDEDNYRFLHEAAENVGGDLVILNSGRDIYDVFYDEHMLGNSRVAPCSKRLKQQPARAWLEANRNPQNTTLYIGLDWTETSRVVTNHRAYAHPPTGCADKLQCAGLFTEQGRSVGPGCKALLPYPWIVSAPMTKPPYLDKIQMLQWCRDEGIEPPRLYKWGFTHANCGGFCVRMGIGEAKRLLMVMPERYAYHEQREQEFREAFDQDVAFLRYRSGPRKNEPMTLRELRGAVESQPSLFDDVDDEIGCDSCFTQMD